MNLSLRSFIIVEIESCPMLPDPHVIAVIGQALAEIKNFDGVVVNVQDLQLAVGNLSRTVDALSDARTRPSLIFIEIPFSATRGRLFQFGSVTNGSPLRDPLSCLAWRWNNQGKDSGRLDAEIPPRPWEAGAVGVSNVLAALPARTVSNFTLSSFAVLVVGP